jgi:hypothetical protein
MRQKLLQIPRLRAGNHLRHSIHVLARTSLHEPATVLPRTIGHIVAIRSKVLCVARHKLQETPADGSQIGCLGRFIISPSFI